jgi:hypothetical protein
MTAQSRKYRDREPGPADLRWRISGPPPLEDDSAAGTAGRAGRDSHGRWLAYSVDEAARLSGLSRGLLYDQMRLGGPAYVKVVRRYPITCQQLQQYLGIVS